MRPSARPFGPRNNPLALWPCGPVAVGPWVRVSGEHGLFDQVTQQVANDEVPLLNLGGVA